MEKALSPTHNTGKSSLSLRLFSYAVSIANYIRKEQHESISAVHPAITEKYVKLTHEPYRNA